ncbi:hypothetical protein HMPREF9096_01657 [Haemophilus sp. oral taxon 851 str. F0397]|nr:hypothetical protein HMPREF9096_01657 [Haemophilus sp. oral taxon 851 str. F0397]
MKNKTRLNFIGFGLSFFRKTKFIKNAFPILYFGKALKLNVVLSILDIYTISK